MARECQIRTREESGVVVVVVSPLLVVVVSAVVVFFFFISFFFSFFFFFFFFFSLFFSLLQALDGSGNVTRSCSRSRKKKIELGADSNEESIVKTRAILITCPTP